MLKDDAVGRLALELLAQLNARKDDAVQRTEYELAADYRDLAYAVERVIHQLSAILDRQDKPGDSGPPAN